MLAFYAAAADHELILATTQSFRRKVLRSSLRKRKDRSQRRVKLYESEKHD